MLRWFAEFLELAVQMTSTTDSDLGSQEPSPAGKPCWSSSRLLSDLSSDAAFSALESLFELNVFSLAAPSRAELASSTKACMKGYNTQ